MAVQVRSPADRDFDFETSDSDGICFRIRLLSLPLEGCP